MLISVFWKNLRENKIFKFVDIVVTIGLIALLAFFVVTKLVLPNINNNVPNGCVKVAKDRFVPTDFLSNYSFKFSKNQVTYKQYGNIMGYYPESGKNDENSPVCDLTFKQIAEFCNKLSEKEGLTPWFIIGEENIAFNFNANGYRPPFKNELANAKKNVNFNVDAEFVIENKDGKYSVYGGGKEDKVSFRLVQGGH